MPNWNEFHGWKAFDQLDELVGLTHAFTIGYRFSDYSADVWTHRFNQFKNKQPTALRGGSAVTMNAIPGLLDGPGLSASSTTFVPALSSNEIVASD